MRHSHVAETSMFWSYLNFEWKQNFLSSLTIIAIQTTAEKETPLNVKVELSLCLTKHHAMKTYWGVEL
jgi:hypothetical protein